MNYLKQLALLICVLFVYLVVIYANPNPSLIKLLKKICHNQDPLEIYDIKEELGEGKYALAYKGIDRYGSKKKVAIKVIPLINEEVTKYAINEIQLTKGLKHPNIVRYYEYYYFDDSVWHITELINGHSLADIQIPGFKWTEENIIILSYTVMQLLRFLEENHICHQDMTASNILMKMGSKNNPEFILIDFGLAQIKIDEFSSESHEDDYRYTDYCKDIKYATSLLLSIIGKSEYKGPRLVELEAAIRNLQQGQSTTDKVLKEKYFDAYRNKR